LAKLGVKRNAKVRALRRLEAAGLITVDWRDRKTPVATLRSRPRRRNLVQM
jgi:DNA-binding PadR family transcriptional regulator